MRVTIEFRYKYLIFCFNIGFELINEHIKSLAGKYSKFKIKRKALIDNEYQ